MASPHLYVCRICNAKLREAHPDTLQGPFVLIALHLGSGLCYLGNRVPFGGHGIQITVEMPSEAAPHKLHQPAELGLDGIQMAQLPPPFIKSQF